jgi:ParB family chromosome partitioning protein
MTTKKRLGRGLDALFPTPPAATAPGRANHTARIEQVHPNRGQPRRRFDEASLEELASSIREHGILEPILVRRRGEDGYEIIAGERRWRAAQKAGLHEIPIFVRELGDTAAFEAALVENLQREDLNPIETARAFQRLIDDHGLTQDVVAERVGKDRSTVSNALRLLKLPDEVLDLVVDGRLSEGHGRALLTSPNAETMKKMARAAVAQKWSVRETERRCRAAGTESKAREAPAGKSANVKDLERRLSHALGAPVAIEQGAGGRGRVLIDYASLDALDAVIAKLLKR